jgi:hypothetical protein
LIQVLLINYSADRRCLRNRALMVLLLLLSWRVVAVYMTGGYELWTL